MQKFDILGEIRWFDKMTADDAEQRQVIDYPLKSRGDCVVDCPPDDIFEQSIKDRLFSGYRIGSDPFRGKLETLEKMTGPVHIDLIRVRPDYKRFGEESGLDYEEYARDYYDRCFDFALKYPHRAMLCGIAEFDSSCPWPKDHYFSTRQEAYEFFKHAVHNKQIGSGDPATFFERLKNRGLSYTDINAMAHGACLFALHYYFEWGFPHVELERGIGTSCNMQVSMAYMRGAWKQYGRSAKWGMDYSTHNTSYNRLNHYLPDGTRSGGRTESLILRSYLLSYLAGADYLLSEGHEWTHYVYQADKSCRLSKLGEEAQKFADYTLRSGKDRGKQIVPAAVMLDYFNGYESHDLPFARPAVWGNCVPYTAADAHITNIFDFLCPGFSEANSDGDPAASALPWQTRQEMLALQKEGFDMRPWEKGYLVPSPCGDCFDVLLDTASQEVLSEYKILILAGTAAPDEEKMQTFMEQGGTLCLAVNQAAPEFFERLGLVRKAVRGDCWDIDVITAWDGTQSAGMRYGYTCFDLPVNARMLAANHLGVPLVIELPVGKGKLLFCTVRYQQDASNTALLPCWKKALQKEIAEHFPLKASSEGLELVLNQTDGGFIAGVFNNNSFSWKGTITLPETEEYALELQPFEARILRRENGNPWQSEYCINC